MVTVRIVKVVLGLLENESPDLTPRVVGYLNTFGRLGIAATLAKFSSLPLLPIFPAICSLCWCYRLMAVTNSGVGQEEAILYKCEPIYWRDTLGIPKPIRLCLVKTSYTVAPLLCS